MTCQKYDVAIVGGGAAGLSAALVLARARRRVVVLDACSPRNAPAAHMHTFLSRDGMPPAGLLALGRAEVLGYAGEIVSATVTGVEATPTGFGVTLDGGSAVAARRLLIATGLTDVLPLDGPVALERVTEAVERVAGDAIHTANTGALQRFDDQIRYGE